MRECVCCGADISHRGRDATSCSVRCQQTARRARERAARSVEARTCPVCQQDFTPIRITKTYCSRRCASLSHYKANREVYTARSLSWMAENRDRWVEIRRSSGRRHERRRRGQRFGGPGVSPRDWQRLIDRHQGRCAYCGCLPELLTMDHVVPLSRGGRHSIGNVLPACWPCNHRKNAKLLVEWRKGVVRQWLQDAK